MMGVGRTTVSKNSNPWGIFNWLPKKHQQAHNIDLTKLQSYTAEELLELLISVHPDISYALYTYLRMGDTDLTFTAKKPNGNADKVGQRVLDELKAMLNTPYLRRDISMDGHGINWTRSSGGGLWFGNYKKINTPTFIYEEFDPMVDDPYGRTPMLPVLQVVFFHLQVLADLKAVVHNQGYPRLDISYVGRNHAEEHAEQLKE